MLVLARKKNQCIVINDNIEIYIVDITNDQVKVGIKAPKDVTVHRKEVHETIKKQMQEAASSSIEALKEIGKGLKKDSPTKK